MPFGIAPPRREHRAKRPAALRTAAGSSPFVVRLCDSWTGGAGDDDGGWLDREVACYSAAGLQVELVVRCTPAVADAGSVERIGSRAVRRARRSRIARSVKNSIRSGRAAVRLELTAKSRGKRVHRVQRRSYRVC